MYMPFQLASDFIAVVRTAYIYGSSMIYYRVIANAIKIVIKKLQSLLHA
jgi:hypothetical protein